MSKEELSPEEEILDCWETIRDLLASAGAKNDLGKPTPPEDIESLERALGFPLPPDFRCFLSLQNGTPEGHRVGPVFLSAKGVLAAWSGFTDIAGGMEALAPLFDLFGGPSDGSTGPEAGGMKTWFHQKLIPFTDNGFGDCLCLNAETGEIFQHRHDGPLEGPVAPSLLAFLEQIEFHIDQGLVEWKDDKLVIFEV